MEMPILRRNAVLQGYLQSRPVRTYSLIQVNFEGFKLNGPTSGPDFKKVSYLSSSGYYFISWCHFASGVVP